MALTDTTTYTDDRDGIIDAALELVGIKETSITPSSAEYSIASKWLNRTLKNLPVDDTHLWTRTKAFVFLEKGKASYNLGTGTYATRDASADIAETTTTSALVASDVIIPVTSSVGMSVGDNVYVLLDDDTLHWDIILTVDSSVQITLTTGVASAAASGATVVSYTKKAHRPLRINTLVIRNTSGDEYKLEPISQDEYMELPNKASAGIPTTYLYEPLLTNGVLTTWPVIDTNGYKLYYTYDKQFDDVTASADDLEVPQEWFLPIVYALAVDLANVYAVEDKIYFRLLRRSAFLMDKVTAFDVEDSSIYINPSEESQ